MSRVKGGPHGHLRHKKVLKMNKGYYGSRHLLFRRANEAMLKSLWYANRDRRVRKRDLRKLVDCPHQRRRPPERYHLQPPHQRHEEGRHHPQPQDARRPGSSRSTGFFCRCDQGKIRLRYCSETWRRMLTRDGTTAHLVFPRPNLG